MWTPVKEIPENTKALGITWIFKIKSDGRYRARMAALGNHQVPGIDFVEIYAPVILDTTLRLLLTTKIQHKWQILKVDIESAFLEGTLKENIWLCLPKSIQEISTVQQGYKYGKLNKAIYGLVQASSEFYRRITQYLVNQLGFSRSQIDPCLFKNQYIFLGLYVDDILAVGEEKQVKKFLKDMQQEFNIRSESRIDDFIGCQFLWNDSQSSVILHQTDLIHKLVTQFESDLSSTTITKLPALQGQTISITDVEQENQI